MVLACNCGCYVLSKLYWTGRSSLSLSICVCTATHFTKPLRGGEERFSAGRMGRYIHTYLLLQTTCCLLNLVFLKRSRLLVSGKKVGPLYWPNHPAISSNHAMPAARLALIRFQRCSSSREDLLPIELTIFGFKIRNWRWDCLNCIALIYGASLLVVTILWGDAMP